MMKLTTLYIGAAAILFGLAGCTSQMAQERIAMKQSIMIEQQEDEIAFLQHQLEQCKNRTAQSSLTPQTSAPTDSAQKYYPKPKQNIKLKKVEDTNYKSAYMYPENKKQKSTGRLAAAPKISMNKSECIALIGEAKFTRYTQMFGSETAALKRCAMIRAMKRGK